MVVNSEPQTTIPLIEYHMAPPEPMGPGRGPPGPLLNNGEMDPSERHYSTLDRIDRSVRPKVKVVSDKRRSTGYDNTANHIGDRLGNHIDSEAAEAMDYYPDDTSLRPRPPPPMTPGIGGLRDGRSGGYVKYNSFANY